MITITQAPGMISITGHARYGPKGSDIVCSAISTLFQTLAASLDALTKDDIRTDIEEGHSRMIYKHLSEAGQLLVDAFFIGCEGVAGAFPEHVNINRTLAGVEPKTEGSVRQSYGESREA